MVWSFIFSRNLNESELTSNINAIFNSENLLQQQYSKTHVFWSFPDSILVPAELMNADRNTNMLNLVFGDLNQGPIRSDFLYKHNLHNVYRTPQAVIDIFSTHLPVATQTHLFTTLVNRDLEAGDHLYTVFYSNGISIMLVKDGKLQVVQHFYFNQPDDCVFHLLNVCKGFDVRPDAVNLHISGLVDKQSGLFSAIYKYFLQISFNGKPEQFTYAEAIEEHPSHFFSHLFSLALCV